MRVSSKKPIGEWKDTTFSLVQSLTLSFVDTITYVVDMKGMDLGQG